MLRHLVPLALAAALGSGTTCSSETSSSQPSAKPESSQSTGAGLAAGGDETKCVDSWLEQKNLDQYGNKAGTMYMGGTPLFDEASGKATDRLEYIYQNHPDAKAACHK